MLVQQYVHTRVLTTVCGWSDREDCTIICSAHHCRTTSCCWPTSRGLGCFMCSIVVDCVGGWVDGWVTRDIDRPSLSSSDVTCCTWKHPDKGWSRGGSTWCAPLRFCFAPRRMSPARHSSAHVFRMLASENRDVSHVVAPVDKSRNRGKATVLRGGDARKPVVTRCIGCYWRGGVSCGIVHIDIKLRLSGGRTKTRSSWLAPQGSRWEGIG